MRQHQVAQAAARVKPREYVGRRHAPERHAPERSGAETLQPFFQSRPEAPEERATPLPRWARAAAPLARHRRVFMSGAGPSSSGGHSSASHVDGESLALMRRLQEEDDAAQLMAQEPGLQPPRTRPAATHPARRATCSPCHPAQLAVQRCAHLVRVRATARRPNPNPNHNLSPNQVRTQQTMPRWQHSWRLRTAGRRGPRAASRRPVDCSRLRGR